MIYLLVLIWFIIGAIVWFGAGYPLTGAIICSISLCIPWITIAIKPIKEFFKFIWQLFKPIR